MNEEATTAVVESASVDEVMAQAASKALDTVGTVAQKLSGYLETAEGVAMEQTPLVIKEILYWAFASNAIIFVAAAAVAYGLNYFANWVKGEDDFNRLFDSDGRSVLWSISKVPGVFIFSIVAFIHFLDALKVLVAPRLYLIEYLSQLVK